MKNFTLLRRTRPKTSEKSMHRPVGFFSFVSFVVAMLCSFGGGATVVGPTYCVPHPYNASMTCSYGMYLNHVSITGTGLSFTDYSGCDGTGYEDRTTAVPPINLTPGTNYVFTVYDWGEGTSYSFDAQIWVDFNDDGTFSSDETVGGIAYGYGTIDVPFSIPATGVSGLHRMRIRPTNTELSYPSMGACDNGYWGEAQDYMVQVGPGCSLHATMSVTGLSCPGGTTGSATVSATGTGTISYTWLHDGSHGTTVSGLAAGSYVVAITNDTCTIYDTAVIADLDATIHGTSVAVGASTVFTDAMAGGVWSSSNPSIATVDSTGLVTGVSAGSVGISYTVPACSFTNVYWTYVSPFLTYCTPSIYYSSDACDYGIYIQNFSVTGDASTGIYDYGTGCGYSGYTDRRYDVGAVTFNAGSTHGASINIPWTGPSAAQVWIDFNNDGNFSSDETVGGGYFYGYGSFDVAIPAGVANGDRTMRVRQAFYYDGSYPYLDPCATYEYGETHDYPVHIGTSITATIEGYGNICQGGTTHYYGSPAGGTWSSDNTDVATLDTAGNVTGIGAGTATISYSYMGATATTVVTVNALPATIYAPATLCAGTTAYVADATAGGTWSTMDSAISFIDVTSGYLQANTPGTATVTYTTAAGCSTSATITVLAAPAFISGSDYPVCVGTTVTFSDATTGGSWTSNNTDVATVVETGVVTGVSTGSVIISYTLADGCGVGRFLNVNPALSAGTISGLSTVVVGSSINLTDETFYPGSWSASNSRVTVDGSGVVTGVSTGTSIISYVVSNSCGTATATKIVTVTAAATTEGSLTVCSGQTTTLTNATAGGTWKSGNSAIARIDSVTGVVTGAAPGVALISYTTAAGYVNTSVTVLALPNVITGTAVMCSGATTTLTSSTGGTWTSMNTDVATISSTGVVSGLTAGTALISYTNANGCSRSIVTTVIAQPTITNSANICAGATAVLTTSVSGGTWSGGSSAASVSAGVVTGVNAGTASVTYSMSPACRAISVVTVNALPSNITGTQKVCPGSTTTLSTVTTGGSWNTTASNVTVGATTGIVTGLAAGTAVVSYTTAAGCSKTAVVTVNASPATIGGTTSTCVGTTATLTNTSSVLSWTSGNTAVATINSTSGVYTGVAAGTAMITFTAAGTNCTTTTAITINAGPGAIGGTATVCTGNTTTLTNAVTGGSWFSGNTSVASVDVAGGVVTGVAAGTATISYMANGCGTIATKVVTVNAGPSAATLTGASSVAIGAATTLTASVTGGSWVSGSTAIATVSSTGVVTGVTAGTVTISYFVYNSCGSAMATKDVTVVPSVAPITGTLSVCVGNTTPLADATTGGTWSTANSAIATIGSTGVVTGVATGVTTVTYTTAYGSVTAQVSVNPVPGITGTASVCLGGISTLGATVTGGSWMSADATIAAVSTSGVVTSNAAGMVSIYYVLPTGCGASTVFTVNALPSVISGASSVCVGATTALSSAPTGGSWSSAYTSVATVSSTGVVTGVASGSTNITYKLSTGCQVVTPFTVTASPAAISGVATVCEGATTTLGTVTTGGTWSSGNTAIATIGTSGVVSGLVAGTSTIAYTTSGGCASTVVVTVNATPSISGTATVCPGSTTVLSSSLTGGSWGGGSAAATVSATGVVSGIATGTASISYVMANGCRTGAVVTVNAAPTAIAGTLKACPGTTSALSSTPTGGSWISSDPTIASIDATTGVVTGVLAGTVNVTYTSGSGCVRTAVFTVNAVPAAITGTLTTCVGSTTVLSNTSSASAWASGNTAVATISSTGVVTGVAAGTSIITFTASGTLCTTTTTVNINGVPAAISGGSNLCVGSTTALTNSVTGGTWSSSNTGIATVGSTNGVVSGVATGLVTITYTTGASCFKTKQLTVNVSSGAITGYPTICVGLTTALSGWGSGVWSSSDATIASVSNPSSGTITGVGAGAATITFTSSTSGCSITYPVTVIANPGTITGTTSVCSGQVSSLADAVSGGSWSSSNVATATIGTNGVVSAVGTGGTVTISYAFGTTCRATTTFTVKALPSAITGTYTVCATGTTTTLASGPTAGTWSSSNNTIATVGTGLTVANGAVTGHAVGTANITYTLTSTGCARSVVVTVNSCSRPADPNVIATTTGLQLYPNPTQGAFTVTSDAAGIMQVYTMEGREVTRFTIGAGINTLSLPTDLARGVYMCRYNSNDGNAVIVRLVYE